jgi:hypothetical protein
MRESFPDLHFVLSGACLLQEVQERSEGFAGSDCRQDVSGAIVLLHLRQTRKVNWVKND